MGCIGVLRQCALSTTLFPIIANLMFVSGKQTSSASRTPTKGLVLCLRRAANDFVNVGAINADVVQLVIQIAEKLLEYAPVGPATPQEAREREHFHDNLLCVISAVNECVGVRNVLSLVDLRSSHNNSILHW
jgi:hypothetical protein